MLYAEVEFWLPPTILGFAAWAAWCSVCRLPAQR